MAGNGTVKRILAAELGVSEQTIHTWRRQGRIDAGLEPGLKSDEKQDLAADQRRIRELETELAVHRRASELVKEMIRPIGGSRRSE